MLCYLVNAPGVYALHIQEVNKGSQRRFNGAAPDLTYFSCILRLHPLMHPVVIWFVDAIIKFLEITFTNARATQWTIFAFAVVRPIDSFLVSLFVCKYSAKRQDGFIATGAFI